MINSGNPDQKKSLVARYYEMAKSKHNSNNDFTFILLLILIIGFACFRIALTYDVFWQTWDEPFHIAAGLEWLDKGTFTYEPYHPPLARLMSALGPFLNGARIVDGESTFPPQVFQGNVILSTGVAYEENLTLARLGILPFFIIASLVVAFWTKKYAGTVAALIAVVLFTTLPPILAHAGVAALDMACAAMVAAALYALTLWLEKPNLSRSVILGIGVGLAGLSKLQALGYVLVAGGFTVIVYRLDLLRRARLTGSSNIPRYKQWLGAIAILLLSCALIIWAGYRFSTGHLLDVEGRPHEKVDGIVGTQGAAHDAAYFILENAPIPAPEFLIGVRDFFAKNNEGHLGYFFGDIRTDGWWYYFPVIFIFKTPLPFLLLSSISIFLVIRNVFRTDGESALLLIPLICSMGILAVSMLGKHTNGIRQILSIYPLVSIAAGYGSVKLISESKRFALFGYALVTILIVWQLTSSFAAHPDYLAYFNELAGNQPERIAVDSDLDWGQDLKRLVIAVNDRGINDLGIKYHGSAGIDLTKFNLSATRELEPYEQQTGWIAISIYNLTLGTGQKPYDQFSWLKQYQPVEKIGTTIWLFHIPEE